MILSTMTELSLSEAKQQVLANLANFAYDPINYEHFRQLNILDLFLGKIGATSQENLSSGVCDQIRLKPACSATETS